MRRLMTAMTLLVVAGCTERRVEWTKPGMNPEIFRQEAAGCQFNSMAHTSDYTQRQTMYELCMQSLGWVPRYY